MKLVKANPLLGFMFKRQPQYGIHFKARLGIHTFFMRFPITVTLLDRDNNLVQTKQKIKPWRIWIWGFQEYTVIELPTYLDYEN